MYDYSRPYCLSRFAVFNEYEVKYHETEEQINEMDNMTFNHFSFFMKEEYEYEENEEVERADLLETPYMFQCTVKSFQDYLKGNYISYNPLEDAKELYIQLFKLSPTNEKRILKFIQKYGCLGPEKFINVESDKNNDSNLIPHNLNLRAPLSDYIGVYYNELVTYQLAFAIWEAIQMDDREKLESYNQIFGKMAHDILEQNEKEFIERYIAEGWEYDPDNIVPEHEKPEVWQEWQSVKDEDYMTIAKAHLLFRINSNGSGIHHCYRMIDGDVVPAIAFRTLIDVAWWQLGYAISKGVQLRYCLNCDSPFAPLHGAQKFCPPLLGRKRSTCENTYNQRIKRQKQKEREDNIEAV